MRLSMFGFAAATCLSLATPAFAQDGPPPDVESARALGDAGLKLYSQKQYEKAFTRLSMAATLVKAPTIRLYMARCKRELGDLVAAREHYRHVTEMPLPVDASDVFRKAKADAHVELADIEERIPTLSVRVGPAAAEASIVVSGTPFSGEGMLNPGEHTVVVTAVGYEGHEAKITLSEGAKEELSVDLVALSKDAPQPDAPMPAEDGSLVPALISFGVAAAGLGVGIGFGLAAKSALDEIESRCIGDSCLMSDEEAADDARILAHVSTAGFVLGGVGLALGTVFLIWRPGGGDGTALHLGPTGATWTGKF